MGHAIPNQKLGALKAVVVLLVDDAVWILADARRETNNEPQINKNPLELTNKRIRRPPEMTAYPTLASPWITPCGRTNSKLA